MDAARWQRIDEVFAAALDQPAGQRRDFLDRACADDAELRREVDSLLAHHGDEAFLASGAAGEAAQLVVSAGRESLLGRRLGPYEIVASLGSGGMGEVYRGRDTRLNRAVAIKVMPPHLAADPEARQRFDREARAISALAHPHICALYDLGSQDGVDFLVMELIEGETLAARLARGPLPLVEALRWAAQVADALDRAHRARIVHRDLKPGNVMLTRSGVKLLDFGLARAVVLPGDSRTQGQPGIAPLTAAGTILGTLYYMSPEQLEGRPVDQRADIFAFGAMLYEMVSGVRAFDGATAASVISSILRDHPAPVSTRAPLAPPALDTLIEHCLAKDPDERWQSARDLHLHLLAIAAPTAGASGSSVRPAIAPPGLAAAAGPAWLRAALLGAAAFTAGMLAAVVALPPPAPELGAYRFTPIATDETYEDDPAFSPDGRSIAYVASVDGLTQVFVRSLASSTPVQLTRIDGHCWNVAWAPDGSDLYFFTSTGSGPAGTGTIWAVSAGGGSPRRVMDDAKTLALSPDGKTLAFLRLERGTPGFALWLSSPPGAPPRRYAAEPFASRRAVTAELAFSPRGDRLAASIRPIGGEAGASELWMLPFPAGEPYRVAQGLAATLKNRSHPSMGWMPDGRRLVFSAQLRDSAAAHLWLLDLDSGSTRLLTTGTEDEESPAVSPDGTRIAYKVSHEEGDLVEVPLDGAPPRKLLATSRRESGPAWSPRGRQYAYITDRTGSLEIWLRSPEEGWERAIVTTADFGGDPATAFSPPSFAPDGQRIVYARTGRDGRPTAWISHLAGGNPVRLDAAAGVNQMFPSWSPDGDWVAYVRGKPDVLELVKGKVGGQGVGVIAPPLDGGVVSRWSPTGRWIAYQDRGGLHLVSSDGGSHRRLSSERAALFGWSTDDGTIHVLRRAEQRLVLASIDVQRGTERPVADLGPAPHVGVGFGFSLAADGRSFATSFHSVLADIWMVEGFEQRPGLLSRLRRSRDPSAP